MFNRATVRAQCVTNLSAPSISGIVGENDSA